MKFRVGIVTIMEVDVETNAWTDALRLAEGAMHHLIGLGNCAEARERPVIKWRHRNGTDYEVAIARRPIELGAAARNGCFTIDVPQLTSELSDG